MKFLLAFLLALFPIMGNADARVDITSVGGLVKSNPKISSLGSRFIETGRSCQNFNSASILTISCTINNTAPGSAFFVFLKHEGLPTTIALADGTNAYNARTLQANPNNDLHSEAFDTLSNATSGNLTFTATYGAARTWNSINVWEIGHVSGALSYDTDVAQSCVPAGCTVITSGNVTTSGTEEFCLGGLGNYSNQVVSSMQVGVFTKRQSFTDAQGFTSWYALPRGIFTGAATASVPLDSTYNAHVSCYKLTP